MKKNNFLLSIVLTFCLYLYPAIANANELQSITSEIAKDVIQIVVDETRKGFAEIVAASLGGQGSGGSLRGKVIVVDAGHGGSYPGASYHGSREEENTLATAKKLETVLKNKGAKVIMTRTEDTNVAANPASLREELLARTALSTKNKADLFISVHNNANTDQSIHGAMTFYYKDMEKPIAKSVQNALVSEVKMKDKGIAKGDFLVLRENSSPSILVEVGFLSNLNESAKLKDNLYQNKLAYAIGKGVENYFSM